MKCASVLTIVLLMIVLQGCEAPAHTADFFQAHPEEAMAVLEACAADDMRGSECANARMGASRARADERRRAADEAARAGNILPKIHKK